MKHPQRGGIVFRLLSLLLLALLFAAVYLLRHPLLRFAGNWWEVQDRPQRSDAVLVLGGDNFNGDRAAKAAELYRANWAPLVVASGRMLRPYAGMAELIGRDLENRGVPPDAILRFPHRANNTLEEAQALRQLALDHKWHRVIVVTSNYHTRRARYIFTAIFPPQITVAVASAKDSDYDPDSWWESRQSRKLFLLESGGYLAALWELRGARSSLAPASAPTPAGPAP